MKKLKIFHGMTDVAGQGSYSVLGLRAIGEKARMVVWRKNPFGYKYDFCLNISKNKWLAPWYAIKLFFYSIYATIKYDVFHFHFTHSLIPHCLDLKMLRALKKRVFMEYHGSDIRWIYNRITPKYCPPEVIPAESDRKKTLNKKINETVDGIVLHDNELRKHLYNPERESVYIIPLRVDVHKFTPLYPDIECKKPLIVHAPSHFKIKGSQYVLDAIENLKQKYNFDFTLVEGKTQEEAFKIYQHADIIIDQLILGTYGVFAIEAMSLGKPVICYVSDDIINEFPDSMPIVNANINNIEQQIEKLINEPNLRHDLGVRGREYAENYHDYKIIANAQKQLYEGTYPAMSQREAFEYIKSIKEG